MSKRNLKTWAWWLILIALVGLIVVGVSAHSIRTQKGSPASSGNPVQTSVSARDGKTEHITLINKQGSQQYAVEIASTPASREQGLSGKDGLATASGMLFIFDKPDQSCFWMKDMKFNLDMLWFDQNQKLIHVQENATPATYPASFCSPQTASYVLEVTAGTVKQLGLQLGDSFISP